MRRLAQLLGIAVLVASTSLFGPARPRPARYRWASAAPPRASSWPWISAISVDGSTARASRRRPVVTPCSTAVVGQPTAPSTTAPLSSAESGIPGSTVGTRYPTDYPCVNTPPASAYWSYWHADAEREPLVVQQGRGDEHLTRPRQRRRLGLRRHRRRRQQRRAVLQPERRARSQPAPAGGGSGGSGGGSGSGGSGSGLRLRRWLGWFRRFRGRRRFGIGRFGAGRCRLDAEAGGPATTRRGSAASTHVERFASPAKAPLPAKKSASAGLAGTSEPAARARPPHRHRRSSMPSRPPMQSTAPDPTYLKWSRGSPARPRRFTGLQFWRRRQAGPQL